MPAGYSGTPLIKKLGIKSGYRVVFLGAPAGYAKGLGALPPDAKVIGRLGGAVDFIQTFVKQRTPLEARFAKLRNALAPAGMLWVCWPKQASGVKTDLNREVVREIGLGHGLVDVKVCAVDETWSGLKFVRRLKDR